MKYLFFVGQPTDVRKRRRVQVAYFISSNPYQPKQRLLCVDGNDKIIAKTWKGLKVYADQQTAQEMAKGDRRVSRAERRSDRPDLADPVLKKYMEKHGKTNIRGLAKRIVQGKHIKDKYKAPLKKYFKHNLRLANTYFGGKANRIEKMKILD